MNLESIKQHANLGAIVERYMGPPPKISGRWLFWRCPWHGGGNERSASFGVTSDNGLFKCYGCGAAGDVFEFVRRMENLGTDGRDFVEVAKKVAALAGTAVDMGDQAPRQAYVPHVQTAPSDAWQAAAQRVMETAEQVLWTDLGHGCLRYLNEKRGLTEATIREWRLGYWPNTSYEKAKDWGLDRDKDVWLPQGLVIPGALAGAMWYVKVRPASVVKFDAKYYGIPGGVTALLGADRWEDGLPLMLCEGEMDLMTVWQEARESVNTATLGGAAKARGGQAGLGRWLSWMMRFGQIYVAYDADPAGEQAREAFGAMSARMEPVVVPFGGDVNGFHLGGGKVGLWVRGIVGSRKSQVGSHPHPDPLSMGEGAGSKSRFPVELIFQPGPGLPVIDGQWRVLEDGRWAVRFETPEELRVVLEVTKAIGEYPGLKS